jgi:hypothetical protein
MVTACVNYFCNYMYYSQPILNNLDGVAVSAIQSMDHSVEAYCLLASLSAYVLLQPQTHFSPFLRLHTSTNPDRPWDTTYARNILDEGEIPP